MKTLIIILIILSLLQATVIPLNLVLIVLVLRAFIVVEKENLILAFVFGLLMSHLLTTPLGLLSILYVFSVQVAQILKKSPILRSPLIVFPLILIILILNELLLALTLKTSINIWPNAVLEALVSLPVFLLLSLWEERFIAKSDIKLKIR